MEAISRICQRLAIEIDTLSYTPSGYTRFAVTDPKLREIYAPSFRDRLVQNWVVFHMNPSVERLLIDDTFANRKGKGALAAVHRAQRLMRQPGHSHYLQLDVQNFFNSMSHTVLLQQCEALLARYFGTHPLRERIHNVVKKTILHPVANHAFIVSNNPLLLNSIPRHKTLSGAGTGRGLPLGSAASQMFANIYMNPLDQFIKHQLRVKGYVRYMDDMLLLGSSSQQLSLHRQAISNFMQTELALTLHPKKQSLQYCRQGADYLGYKVYPHHLHLRKRNINKLLAWLRFFNESMAGSRHSPVPFKVPLSVASKSEWHSRFAQASAGIPDFVLMQHMQSVINSYLGMMKHANFYRLRKDIWHRHAGLLKAFMLPGNAQYTSVRIKKYCLQDWVSQQHLPILNRWAPEQPD